MNGGLRPRDELAADQAGEYRRQDHGDGAADDREVKAAADHHQCLAEGEDEGGGAGDGDDEDEVGRPQEYAARDDCCNGEDSGQQEELVALQACGGPSHYELHSRPLQRECSLG